MLPKRGITISGSFLWMCGFFLLVSSADVLCAILFAAALHEAGHLLMLRCFGVRSSALRLSAFGAQIQFSGENRLSYWQEILVAAAGPAVNLLCAALCSCLTLRCAWEELYVFIGVHLTLCLYNLLPILPLDGGRILYCLFCMASDPVTALRVMDAAGLCLSLLCAAAGVWVVCSHGSCFLLLAAAGLLGAQLGLVKRRRSV